MKLEISTDMLKISLETVSNLINKLESEKQEILSTNEEAFDDENKLKDNPSPISEKFQNKSVSILTENEKKEKESFSYYISFQSFSDDWISKAHNVVIFETLLENYFTELYYYLVTVCLDEINRWVKNCDGEHTISFEKLLCFPVALEQLLSHLKVF